MSAYYCRRCRTQHHRITHAVPNEPIRAWDVLIDVALTLVAALGVYAALVWWLTR